MNSKIRLSMFALAGALLAAATTPAGARFHTKLTKSNPAVDTTLAASPKVIELWWNEKPEVSLTTVTVQGADSAMVGLVRRAQAPTLDPAKLGDFCQSVFTRRRKQLGAVLGRDFPWPPGVRAENRIEELPVDRVVALAAAAASL